MPSYGAQIGKRHSRSLLLATVALLSLISPLFVAFLSLISLLFRRCSAAVIRLFLRCYLPESGMIPKSCKSVTKFSCARSSARNSQARAALG
jgi:hypothetical protein